MSKKNKHLKQIDPEPEFKSVIGTHKFIAWLSSKEEILTGENEITSLKKYEQDEKNNTSHN